MITLTFNNKNNLRINNNSFPNIGDFRLELGLPGIRFVEKLCSDFEVI